VSKMAEEDFPSAFLLSASVAHNLKGFAWPTD